MVFLEKETVSSKWFVALSILAQMLTFSTIGLITSKSTNEFKPIATFTYSGGKKDALLPGPDPLFQKRGLHSLTAWGNSAVIQAPLDCRNEYLDLDAESLASLQTQFFEIHLLDHGAELGLSSQELSSIMTVSNKLSGQGACSA
jgi:hypothetical protein